VYRWVQFDKTLWHVEPGEHAMVGYRLHVPQNALPGGHYGVIFAETQPAKDAPPSSVVRKKRVGSIVLATVKGAYTNAGSVIDTAIPFWQTTSPMTSSTTIENTGTADFKADVMYRVSDSFGGTKYTSQKSYTIYPRTIRKIPLEWPSSPWFGLFKVRVEATILGKTSAREGYVLMLPRWLPVVAGAVALGWVYVAFVRPRQKR
jgi:hypothetical protein